MKAKHIFFIILILSSLLIIWGAVNGNLALIYNFGRFICFDCIGIS